MVKQKHKSLKELYEILLESYKNNVPLVDGKRNRVNDYYYSFFLCNHITDLEKTGFITNIESSMLLANLHANRPTKLRYVEFYNNPSYYKRRTSLAWWKFKAYSPKGIEEKIKFLNHLISIHSTE